MVPPTLAHLLYKNLAYYVPEYASVKWNLRSHHGDARRKQASTVTNARSRTLVVAGQVLFSVRTHTIPAFTETIKSN